MPTVTYFAHVKDTSTDHSAVVPWSDLVETLTDHKIRPSKDGPGWSPTAFAPECSCGRSSCPGPRGHRIDQNVQHVTALVLDLDKEPDGTPLTEDGAQAALDMIRAKGLEFVAHTTHSHNPPERQSWRVVVELSEPVPVVTWAAFWDNAIAYLGVHVESACRNPARFWYLPSSPIGFDSCAYKYPGKPLNVPDFLHTPAIPAHEPTQVGDREAPIIEGGRNNTLARVAGYMRKGGFGESAIASALLAENTRRVRPPLPEAEVRAIAASIARYAPEDDIFGTATLTDRIFGTPEPTGPLAVRLDALAAQERPPIETYPTTIARLNRLMGGGLSTRQLTVCCAPPGAGKSGLAITIALAVEKAIPVLIVSTELESHETVGRTIAQLVGRPWRDIVRAPITPEAAATLAGRRMYVIGCESLGLDGTETVAKVVREAERIRDIHGIAPVIMIDYLQDLIHGVAEARLGMGEIAMTLRIASQHLDCPVFALSSVSRAYYGIGRAETMRMSEDASVYLAAAKESGSIDFAAATVLFLDVDGELARIAVAKARHGQTGFVGMKFNAAVGSWEEHPESLHKMTDAGKKQAETHELHERVIAYVEMMQGKGTPPSKSRIVESVEGQDKRLRGVVEHLIETGKIELRDLERVNSRKQIRKFRGIVTPEYSEPKLTPEPSADLGSIIKGLYSLNKDVDS
jgi:hypothetical protein